MTTSLTRRGFLASASAFAATALAACGGGGVTSMVGGGGGDLPLPLETDPERRLARVERAHFEPLVGEPFRMADDGAGPGGATDVVLVRLDDRGATNPDAEAMGFREPFALALRGPEGVLGHEGPYVLHHPEIGDIPVFVSYGGAVEDTDATGLRTVRNAYRITFG